jgi:TusA-related sulfurtransferase
LTAITIRLDVDYAYPSRYKSFFYTALSSKTHHKNYLKNSKIIAKMINESKLDIRTVWFFTPYTIPDQELLNMLTPDRHEVALHVANKPYEELDALQKATGRKVNYYTVHGTARLLGKIIWKRKLNQGAAPIPAGFPLQSFYVYPTFALDITAHKCPVDEATQKTQEAIAKGEVLHAHPEWLFQRGTLNHRGPYYETLKRILQVDGELDYFAANKKGFFRLGRIVDVFEYLKDTRVDERFMGKLRDRDVDVFTFVERSWCGQTVEALPSWTKVDDNIALLTIDSYEDWWEKVGKKTRNMVRKAEKSGIQTQVVPSSEKLAEGIWKIFNESPIRQERASPYYGRTLEKVTQDVMAAKDYTFVAAYLQDELAGFIQLVHGNNLTIITQILALQKHSDKAVNNALIAKVVEVCAQRGEKYVMYGRMGNHPSLDKFKESNNFVNYPLNRYYIPLTRKGKLAIKLGLQRDLKDAVPPSVKNRLFGVYNWVSRTKVKVKTNLH